MDRDNHTKQFVKGTMIMTVAALIIKVLSAVYRIPFQNIVGDVGFYIYQQVYPLYGIMMILGTYGFPMAISKLIAHEENILNRKRIMSAIFVLISAFCLLFFLIIFFGAGEIAQLMHDQELTPIIQVVACTFLILPFTSSMRGYFQGIDQMLSSAISLTLEQFIRVGTILFSSAIMIHIGCSLYTIGAGAMFGAVTGGFFAAIALLFFLKKTKSAVTIEKPTKEIWIQVGKALLLQGFAFCLTNMLLVLLQLMDSFQVYAKLLAYGVDTIDAKQIKGVFDRGQPLIQLGTVISTSLGLSIVPILVKIIKSKNQHEINEKVKLAMKLSVGIGLGAATGLVLILHPINIMLFSDDKGTTTLMILMGSVFLTSIIVTGATILQTVGKTRSSVYTILLIVLIKFIGNSILITQFGVKGAAIATVFALLVGAIIIYSLLCLRTEMFIFSVREIVSLISADIFMIITLFCFALFFPVGDSRLFAFIHAAIATVVGAIIYILFLFRLRFFTEIELSVFSLKGKLKFLLPKYKKIM